MLQDFDGKSATDQLSAMHGPEIRILESLCNYNLDSSFRAIRPALLGMCDDGPRWTGSEINCKAQ